MVLILHHAKKIKQYSDDVDDAAAAVELNSCVN